jgi:putative transposase
LTLANRESFENSYRIEQDAKTKERILLVLNVVYQGKISAAQVARDLHRSKAWACEWLKRYSKEGIEGLKDRTKSGRPPKLSKETSYQIKQELKQSNNQGWTTTKQVEELITKKSRIKYHYTHIYRRILRKWGFKQKVPRKVHVNTASREEKNNFKKRQNRYFCCG